MIGRQVVFIWNNERVPGVRVKDISRGAQSIDVSDGEDTGYQTLIPAVALRSCGISMQGVTKSSALSESFYSNNRVGKLTLLWPDNRKLTGIFHMQSYGEGAQYNDAVTFSAEFASSEEWTEGVVTPSEALEFLQEWAPEGESGVAFVFAPERSAAVKDGWDGPLSKDGVPSDLWDFQRASTATYVGADGLLRTAAVNEGRFAYNPETLEPVGLLMEGGASNLLTHSEDMSNAAWAKNALLAFGSGSIIDAIAAPNGAVTADFLCPNTSSTQHFLRRLSTSMTGGVPYAFSIWLKPGGYSRAGISMYTDGFASGAWTNVNLNDGTDNGVSLPGGGFSNGSIQVESFPDGWKRLTLVATPAVTAGDNILTVTILDDAGTGVFAGDGTSGLYVWGAQFETRPRASSYIPTTTAGTTRAADAFAVGPDNFPTNESYSLYWRGRIVSRTDPSVSWFMRGDDSTANNRAIFREGLVIAGADAWTTEGETISAAIADGGEYAMAMSVEAGALVFAVNGTIIDTANIATTPILTRLFFSVANSAIQELIEAAHFTRALTASELIDLTGV